MNSDLSKKTLHQIEILCEQGCSQINQILEKAKKGKKIEELTEFNQTEIKQIINELEIIMSVYDETNDDNE